MKVQKLFIFMLILNINLIYAQPLPTRSIKIDNICYNNEDVFFYPRNGMYQSITKKEKDNIEKKNGYPSLCSIYVNSSCFFVREKDIMEIKLLFDRYSNYQISINKLFFKKGTYIIDFKKCVEKYKKEGYGIITIENFPCDCIIYRKEEE